MQILNLNVTSRAETGKGPGRRARAAGNVPGIVYGQGGDPLPITINLHRFTLDVINKAGEHAIVQMQVEDKPELSGPALLKAVHHHPVTDRVLHADFMRIKLDKAITTAVTVHFTGRAKGVIDGGVADIQMHEIEIECLPLDVPTAIDVDITGLGLGESLHVRDIVVAENCKVVTDGDRTLIAIHVPRALAEATAAAAAEPAVIGADKKDEGKK